MQEISNIKNSISSHRNLTIEVKYKEPKEAQNTITSLLIAKLIKEISVRTHTCLSEPRP